MMDGKTSGELAGLNEEISNASAALQAFAEGPARRAADEVAVSFERAGQRIARSLGRAAFDGELSFKRLAKVILEELAKVVLSNVFASKSSFFGARANGGAVNPGGAYLVGERGPEWFVPHQSGAIAPQVGGVSVHFHLSGGADANAIARHQGQIAASIARAVAYGRRNL